MYEISGVLVVKMQLCKCSLSLNSLTFFLPIFTLSPHHFHPPVAPISPTGVGVTNIHPHSVDLSWNAQPGVGSYIVQYTQTQGASQLGECKDSNNSGSVSTTNASTSITVQGSGDDIVRAFTTYSITVTAVSVTSFLGSSAPSVAVLVTTTQTGLTHHIYIRITLNILFAILQ